jgi:CHAD domain-containing protein
VPYNLQLGEPVPAGIKRIVREEIESAARQLRGQGESSRDEAIHEARKNVKKIRGVLRLMQPELGEVYRAENIRFRDAGRQLSEFRDASAMVETFDGLVKKYREELGRSKLASIRRGLVAHKQQAERQNNIETVLASMATALRRSARGVAAWPLAADGFSAIEPGLEATFRRGRKVLARARKHPSPENYHEWRKRVKEHWYHVRLLENYWTEAIGAYEKSLKELETALGDDHNLVLLSEKVSADPAGHGKAPDITLFDELIEKYHKALRGDALKLGKHIYGEKPRQFTKRMRRLWSERPVQ